MKRLAAIAALFLGCAGSIEGQQVRDALAIAAARWEHATGIPAEEPETIEVCGRFRCGASEGAIGCYHYPTESITIDACDGDAEWALAHEYGHYLGAVHLPPGTLMAPGSGSASHCITAADVDEVCLSRACPVRRPECN